MDIGNTVVKALEPTLDKYQDEAIKQGTRGIIIQAILFTILTSIVVDHQLRKHRR